MKIAEIERENQALYVHRLNTAYIADIKSSIVLWMSTVLFFSILGGLSVAFNTWLRHMGNTPPSNFLSLGNLLELVALSAFVMAVNCFPSVASLSSPQLFCFDQANHAFFVDGKKVSNLDKITLRLQDGWGPSRRAFRLVVSAGGRDYVLAQTQRITTSIMAGKEYSYIAVDEGRQGKYQLRRWADYKGQSTGFSKDWPGYAEIFLLYADLLEYISTSDIATASGLEQS